MRDALAQALGIGLLVDEAGGENDGAGAQPLAVGDGGERVAVMRERAHRAVPQLGAVAPRLFAQPLEQRRPGDALEARIIVAHGDQRGAAVAGIDDQRLAAVAREIDRRRQSGRAAADDQAVEHGVTRPPPRSP